MKKPQKTAKANRMPIPKPTCQVNLTQGKL